MSTAFDTDPFSKQPGAMEPRPSMATERFRSWLVHDKRYSDKAVSSVLSQCRRVERELGLSLDAAVSTGSGLESVIERIRNEILVNASDKTRSEGQASLFAAVRRYHEFLRGGPGTILVGPRAPRRGLAPRLPRSAREGTSSSTEHSRHSSYREMLLEQLFAGAVMRHLWLKGFRRLELLRPQVDDGGYDLVIEANAIVRHVQMKSSHHGAATASVNINVALAEKPSGCVIWLRFDPESLDLGPFLWFGGAPGEKLPDLASFKVAKHTKGNAQGVKTERPNIRTVPRARFEHLATIDEVVGRLFGGE